MLKSLFEYKRWANDELMTLGEMAQSTLTATDLQLFIRILNHTFVVDRIFAGHLVGEPHGYAATNTDETPDLLALKTKARVSDDWYVHYVDGLAPAALAEVLSFRFTDGEAGRISRGEMLHHLIAHGAYHRGAAGRILATHGIQPPRDSLTVFCTAPSPSGGVESHARRFAPARLHRRRPAAQPDSGS
ncbi:DinB family protein [Ottowia beijingensis]|uniref:DinB family protein n=1 Tax=Ottowia beijingensis TaxID=1207057 RepID=UPI00214D668F|nr:DinB family protein [Ottowia beijingensis]